MFLTEYVLMQSAKDIEHRTKNRINIQKNTVLGDDLR